MVGHRLCDIVEGTMRPVCDEASRRGRQSFGACAQHARRFMNGVSVRD